MIRKNSLRQLFRTPVKTAMFFLLFTASVLLIVLGVNLWYVSATNLARFEEVFTTIGTVEQKPETMEKVGQWNWEREGYAYHNTFRYGKAIPESVLDIEGVEYLSGPERRPCYSADTPWAKLWADDVGFFNSLIVLASPVEDGIPAGPIDMKIKKVLYYFYYINFDTFMFCDHYNPEPEMMYKDKTYIMSIRAKARHHWREYPLTTADEYIPVTGILSDQSTKDGELIGDVLPSQNVQEVTDGFYQSEDWKRWQTFVKMKELSCASAMVTPTNDLNLIRAFHSNDAFILKGEAFSQEDYEQGNYVCLVSRRFAKRNKLDIGSVFHLPLRCANYAQSAGIGHDTQFDASVGLLNAKGEMYPVFEDNEYTVTGIYDVVAGASSDQGYKLHENEIIVPAASIRNSDENNIMLYGPMKGYTTSFQIKNGTVDEFMEAWRKTGIDGLEITFYDKGYSKLEEGLNNMRNMSVAMLVAGFVAAVFILLFFCHMLITKQEKRTAIERSLGMTAGQCARSLLWGILLVALIGAIAGGIGGALLTEEGVEATTKAPRFSTQYSDGQMGSSANNNDEETQIEVSPMEERMWISAGSGLVMLLLAGSMSFVTVRKNLKCEPLELLSRSK
ncbi:MAG: hypothetical protein PHO41_11825 [Eubacteriales bacterium]|nr:hypothetical protein [Eubacteriales bacterium]